MSSQLPWVYWIENGTLYYRSTGGEKKPLLSREGGATLTGGLAVDMVRERVYWTEQTSDTTWSIRSAGLDGTNVTSLVVLGMGDGMPSGIAVDAKKGRVYWTSTRGKIQCVNVKDSGLRVDGSFQRNFIPNLNSPKHIAFDETSRRLYWTQRDSIWSVYPDSKGRMNRRLNTGSLEGLGGIAVANSTVYWTEQTGNEQGKVRSVNQNGSGGKLLAVLEGVPEGIAVDVVGGKLYWTTSDGEIQSLDREPVQTVVGNLTEPAGIALGRASAESIGAAPSAIAPSAIREPSEENALLANYPNPFNPETWIPYQLSEPAEVTVSIYSVNGSLIRTLALGHQSAGVYQSKSRAAYWDGRNAFGERVASGLYFYTLTAGDFTATRKMLIRK